MGTLYLVRHADAGHRSDFDGPDRQRPLSARGHRQAEGLGKQLEPAGITRLLASPFVRCVQSLEPLAARLGLEVEADDRLAEGRGAMPALGLAEELRREPAVFCSHGDVIPDILEELVRRGIRLRDGLRWQKASTWALTWEGNDIATGAYLPPPH